MSPPVRVAVVGAGIMGTNHVRVLNSIAGAELVAVVDADPERSRAVATDLAIEVCDSIDTLPTVDAAIVAVPTPAHVQTAVELIGRGVHVLVEKPLAATVDDARAIVEAAERAGVVLAVGHIERFNPAVVELGKIVQDPIHIAASRISPYSPRIGDGVVFDLMIHDIDIVCSLAAPGDRIEHVSGVARAVNGDTEDIATVTLAFSSGLTASLTTSRLGQQKIRSLEVTEPKAVISADLVRNDITVHRMDHHEFLSDAGVTYRQTGVVEIPFIQNRAEPLALELEDFVNAVRTGAAPRVGGADAVRAVSIATNVLECLYVAETPDS